MITYEVNVLCDTWNCLELLVTEKSDQADSHAALVKALNAGWIIKNGKHLCPKCAVNH